MKFSNAKAGLTLILVAGAAAIIFLQYQTRQKLLAENDSLRQQIAQLKTESEEFSNRVASASKSQPLSSEQLNELLRLRGEVGALRSQTNQLAKLRDENQKMRDAFIAAAQEHQRATDPNAEKDQAFAILEMTTAKQSMLGMIMYANDHENQFPTNFDQAANYFKSTDSTTTNLNRFEIVYQGSWTNLANPSTAIVVRELQPWTRSGSLLKAYGFGDGHSEVHKADPNGSFDEWEQQHVAVLKNQ